MAKMVFVSTMNGNPWGGSEELWSQAALLLARQGAEVKASVKEWPQLPRQIRELEQEGCEIEYRQDEVPLRVQRNSAILNHLIKRENRFRDLFSFKPDLVVLSQGSHLDCLEWGEECLRRRLKYIIITQLASEHFQAGDLLRKRLARVYEKAIACFFVSQANLNLARLQLSASLKNARIVRNPFNVRYRPQLPWPRLKSGYKLACVARMEPSAKGQDLLFEVLAQEKWRNRPAQITLFGAGKDEQSLKGLKRALKLKNIRFGGFVSNIESIWRRHHALILPSRHEGLPLALVEAMLCGRPCIVTDAGGNKELVRDGKTGFLAESATTEHFDRAMERAWERRSSWREMGETAADFVRKRIPENPAEIFAGKLADLLRRKER